MQRFTRQKQRYSMKEVDNHNRFLYSYTIYLQLYHIQLLQLSKSKQDLLMFANLRNYSKNIEQAQRFYYDNYDYYNIYENFDTIYKDDLSKCTYKCNRRSSPLILNFGSHFRFKYSRLTKYENLYKTMEDFTKSFLRIYMENNYFAPSRLYEQQKPIEPFIYHQFSPITDMKYNEKFKHQKILLLSKEQLVSCLQLLRQKNENKISFLTQEYQKQENRLIKVKNLEFYFALELYSDWILKTYYQDVDKITFLLLFQFVIEMHRLMWDILNARFRTVLLMAQPKLFLFDHLLHPLILPITTFLKYSHNDLPQEHIQEQPSLYNLVNGVGQKKPRIVFLNLDGRETPHNLRSIGTLGEQILYISIYQEPSRLQRKEVNLQNIYTSDEQNFQINYSNLWQIFSELIIKEYKQIKQASNSHILLFPLNSSYVYKQYLLKKMKQQANSNISSSFFNLKHPQLSTSNQIHLLFQQIIFEQIRKFHPTMIFISYNGQISILEDHFTDIVRNCSIIADHKVILFTNFVHLFEDESLDESESQDQAEKILCANQFYQKYLSFNLEGINEERLYNNLSLFVKYGSGIYSMEDKIFGSPSSKYSMHRFYYYLQGLAHLEQFRNMENFTIRKWDSFEIQKIFQNYLQWEIKQNRKESKGYESLLTSIIEEIISKNGENLEQLMGKKLYYRYRYIEQELIKQLEEIQAVTRERLNVNQEGEDIQYERVEQEEDSGREAKISKLIQNYFESEKQKLLGQNLQNYKIKKFFYLGENHKNFGQVICYKFLLTDHRDNSKQGEQIFIQKYSQVIVNPQYEDIFILNYKLSESNHAILHGSLKNSQIQKQIHLTQVIENELQQIKSKMQNMHISDQVYQRKQDILYLQYNHAVCDRVLYLFWPLLWNMRQEATCRLLKTQYRPKRIHKMIRIAQYQNQFKFRFEQLLYEPEVGIEVLPRWGCSCLNVNGSSFYIFGGIFDNENDFKMIGSGVHVAQIKNAGRYKYYTIKTFPKSRNKEVVSCLRPKINYLVKNREQINFESCYKLCGGYGRQSTGFFNIFSYDQYELNNVFLPTRIVDAKINRRIVQTEKPLQSQKIGKYNVIINNHNVSQIEQKFSDSLKDKFLFQKRIESVNKQIQCEHISFIDQSYRVSEYRTDPKKIFLFGFDRTIREKIYMKCWSPQLYIVDGNKDNIVNLSLKTEKNSSYIITNYLMPREEDIVSIFLEEDRLYLLCNSPIIHSIDKNGLKFVLYEGSLSNISQVIRKKQIQMVQKFSFGNEYEKFLNEKTIFVNDEKIYLVGGLSVQIDDENMDKIFEREDYSLQTYRKKFRLKVKKVRCRNQNLDMPSSYVIKQGQYFLLYSVIFQDNPSEQDEKQRVEWKLKVEKFSYEQNEEAIVKVGTLKTYVYNKINLKGEAKLQKLPHEKLDRPKITKIIEYKPLSHLQIHELIAKIKEKLQISKYLQKNRLLQLINLFTREKDDKELQRIIIQNWECYEKFCDQINKNQQNFNLTEINQEKEDIFKDLAMLYTFMFRIIVSAYVVPSFGQQLYIFVVEDSSSKKSKYLALGPLFSTDLNFFKIRFKYELLTSLNQNSNELLFYHPIATDFYHFQFEALKPGDQSQWHSNQITKTLEVSLKQ